MRNVVELGKLQPASPEEGRGELSAAEQGLFEDSITGLTGDPNEKSIEIKGQKRTIWISEAAFSPDPATVIRLVSTRNERELRVATRKSPDPDAEYTEETFRVGPNKPYYGSLVHPESLGFDPAQFAKSILQMPADAPLRSPQGPDHTLTSGLCDRAMSFINMCDVGTNQIAVPTGLSPFQNS